MTQRLLAFVLLAALLLQAAAAFGPAPVAQRAGDIEHMLVHSQDADHHHHADSSLHIEDGVGVQHSHPDYSSSTAALMNADCPALVDSGSSSLAEAATTLWISATVDRPLRPPTQRA
ncbi:MAG: hypothetical protein RIS90_1461 [Pseudomonadota bacterium]